MVTVARLGTRSERITADPDTTRSGGAFPFLPGCLVRTPVHGTVCGILWRAVGAPAVTKGRRQRIPARGPSGSGLPFRGRGARSTVAAPVRLYGCGSLPDGSSSVLARRVRAPEPRRRTEVIPPRPAARNAAACRDRNDPAADPLTSGQPDGWLDIVVLATPRGSRPAASKSACRMKRGRSVDELQGRSSAPTRMTGGGRRPRPASRARRVASHGAAPVGSATGAVRNERGRGWRR